MEQDKGWDVVMKNVKDVMAWMNESVMKEGSRLKWREIEVVVEKPNKR
jgi:hypothetical protein